MAARKKKAPAPPPEPKVRVLEGYGEPDAVIVERLLDTYRVDDNVHNRLAAHEHAQACFGVNLSTLADERREAEKKAAE